MIIDYNHKTKLIREGGKIMAKTKKKSLKAQKG